MRRIRMTDADWQRRGTPLDCPHCGDGDGFTFVGDAGDGAWSVVRCRVCSGEIEVSPSWVDEHSCECGEFLGDEADLENHIERELETSDPCAGARELVHAIEYQQELDAMSRAWRAGRW